MHILGDEIKLFETRMRTFIKAELEKSDWQMSIDKYKMFVYKISAQTWLEWM